MGMMLPDYRFVFQSEDEKGGFIRGLEASLADIRRHLQWYEDRYGVDDDRCRGIKLDEFCVQRKLARAKEGNVIGD